jgi:amino acid adenylation domain-containing protein
MSEPALDGIAIIGMAGRFPRARNLEELWRNLRDGVDCISDFADEELEAQVPPEVLRDPRFVRSRGVLDDIDLFAAAFFDIPPRQAELMDPQHRLFLETSWQALEDAGYDPQRFPGSIGVFGGVTLSSYFLRHLQSHPDLLQALGSYQVALGTDRDYLTTLVSYKLGLRGPSVDVQTACSTSLVATVLACQSLLGYHCDMALAGGVSIKVPQRSGYLYQPGGLDSSDGRCRAFDARADGSVYGSGVGVVVLKRLEDALADGDAIHAVILGGAINNDGAARVGFTAPGVEGQAEVIANAQALAGVDPETIGYVECHGTGTALGDPIEVAALTRAFRAGGSRRRGFCAIGSVKASIGHCSAAAGIAGLIKTALALRHRQIPPSLHFEQPNPAIDFAATPFRVSRELADWAADGHPRRAGVSSFGLGGTNAHVVLEEAPEPEPPEPSRPWQLLVLSARSAAALEAATDAFAGTDLTALPDIAFTAQVGRHAFAHRRALVCRDGDDARQALAGRDPRRLLAAVCEPGKRPVAFLFPGVGDHYPGMARGLYEGEPTFREHLNRCCDLLSSRLGGDLREVIFAGADAPEGEAGGPDLRRLLGRTPREGAAPRLLDRTLWAQPAVFAVEIALARLWMEWGVRPDALLGDSLGEYTAACLAGVLSLEEAALLVAERARLLDGLPAGAMLAVPLSEAEIAPRLAAAGLDLAAVNAPGVCAAAGPVDLVLALRDSLAGEGIPSRLLPAAHAFHSRWMEPAAPALTRLARGLRLAPPKIPYVSDVTGTWITPAEATDPGYWARHLCRPVRFAAGLAALWQDPARVLLEVGPGFGLSTLALQTAGAERLAIPSLRNEHDRQPDQAFLLTALGKLWLAGVEIDWQGFHRHERRRRVRLPGYPFERSRFWIEAGRPDLPQAAEGPREVVPGALTGEEGFARARELARGGRLVLVEDDETARRIARLRELEALGAEVVVVGATEAAARPAAAGPPQPALAARHERPRLRNAYVTPETAAEARVAGIFEEILGIRGVGAHDSFFEMGGHSLLGTQVLARLRERCGVELELAVLFAEPTAAGLARRLDAAADAAGRRGEARPVRAPRDGDLPLSSPQERLWFLDRLMPGNPFYNLAGGVLLSGPLDAAALRAALAAMARRHETLRTGFPEAGGRPVQRIAPEVEVALPVADLTALPAAARAAAAGRIAAERAGQPFDLARPPLLRATLLRLGARDKPENPEEPEHALLYTIHHIISDAWSMGVLTREIALLYGAFAAGEPPPLSPLPLQYADYAVWQRGWMAGEVLEGQLGYWRRRLAGAPVTELMPDRPRPPVQTFRGATRRVSYPAPLAAAVAALAQRHGASPFMVLLAGFLALLARWTGQEDLVVGTPIANRRHSELEGMIGLFVNTLVLRTDLGGDPDARALIERVKEVCLGAYAHQDLPFEQLVEELRPQRDLARNPLFQIMFNLLNTPVQRAGPGTPAGRLTLTPLPPAGGVSLFDLNAYVTHGEEGIGAAWEYAGDLFSAPTVERFSRAFAAVLTGMTARPAARLGDLPLLGAAEEHQLTAEWNDTAAPVADLCLHRLFAASAAADPSAPAVLANGIVTYGELDLWATRLAAALRRRGLRPGDRAGVLLERSPAAVAALLGILKAGAAYVPLDPGHPAERLAFLLRDAGASLLVTREGQVPAEVAAAVRTVDVDAASAEAPEDAGEPVPDVLAYIIYTSGSTGAPKGVMITHRQAANTLLDVNRRFAVGKADRVLAVSSLSFDLSVWDLFGIFAAGGAVVLPPPAAQPDPASWSEAMARGGVTVWNSAPALLEMLVDAGAPLPPTLRLVLLSGDWIPVSLPGRVRRQVPAARVVSLGGATEGSIWSIVYPVGAVDPLWRSIPYGRPLAAQRFHVLDRWSRPAPIGVPGELCAGGAGVAAGYLARPDLTAERFVPDPFGPPGGRLYRTGDLGRFRADGVLELLGRLDHQVKIRGFRIELGEIEAALARHPDVQEAVAVARGGRLVAYAVPAAGRTPDPAALRAALAARLPEPMVPAQIVVLERLPLTANGKVDRRALPAPEAPVRTLVAPRDPIEERLAALWRRLLGVPEVSVQDNFFTIGGHSLLATRLVAAIREELGVEVPLREVFEHPVLADLALAVAGRQVRELDEDELSRMFQDLDGLSDEEVDRLLAAGEALREEMET